MERYHAPASLLDNALVSKDGVTALKGATLTAPRNMITLVLVTKLDIEYDTGSADAQLTQKGI
jgi:hypothetical protein